MRKLSKRYNMHTGGYKIDVYLNGTYLYSTDWYLTLKRVKQEHIKKFGLKPKDKLVAAYDKD